MCRLAVVVVVVALGLAAPAAAQTVWYTSATDTGPDVVAGPGVWGGMCNIYGVDEEASSCTHPNRDEWDYVVQPARPGDCSQLCGMGFVYWWQGYAGRPWAQPGQAFYLSASNAPSSVLAPPGSWWHGFTCAQFEDTTTRQQILWCTQPWWQSPDGAGHGVGDHWDPTGWPHAGGPWGDWNPFQDGPTLVITAQQLQAEVARANANLATAPDQQRPYSTSPADYALDGVTCGLEGAGSDALMHASAKCTGLTAYSDVPPAASSSAPSSAPPSYMVTQGRLRHPSCRRRHSRRWCYRHRRWCRHHRRACRREHPLWAYGWRWVP